jgi:ABC-type polysaccharide/polyol phosphate transport system ATPase subunit
MMVPTGVALRVSGLGKLYRLYDSPAQQVRELLLRRPAGKELHALRDVSFELPEGRTLGVIGDNGAGKSTLLQLIAGALTPSTGTIECRGKVLGLLELGLGFHPEFTGRENVLFYGDVLGLSRAEVAGRFDEIADFSELGEFLDRPLKTYSTGMRMRLAFSLVSSLDPDVLIVDEALAVGDLHFQKKCIDRMMDLKARGRTIVFCSHSTYQVGIFCDEVLWIKAGSIHMRGEPAQVLPLYEAYQAQKDTTAADAVSHGALGGMPVRITDLAWVGERPLRTGRDLVVRLRLECVADDLPYHVSLSLKMDNGRGVYVTGTHLAGRPPLRGRDREVLVTYTQAPLLGGLYSLHARVFDDQGLMVYHEKALPEVEVAREGRELGVCRLAHRWEVR